MGATAVQIQKRNVWQSRVDARHQRFGNVDGRSDQAKNPFVHLVQFIQECPEQQECPKNLQVDRLIYYGVLDGKPVDEILRLGQLTTGSLGSCEQAVVKAQKIEDTESLQFFSRASNVFAENIPYDNTKPTIIYLGAGNGLSGFTF